jgi:hypothetical protein
MISPLLHMRTIRLSLLLLLLLPGVLRAQAGRVLVEENVRAAPNGVLLGQLAPGTLLEASNVDGDWVEFTLEGWVWTRSLRVIDRGGFDLVVSGQGGENLRDTPSGSILGRFENGTLLQEIERVPGWVRVRRTMWVWAESLAFDSSADANEVPVGDTSPPVGERYRMAGPTGLAVLNAPDGDTLVRVRAGGDVEVLAREGSWARVRVEGWAWLPLVADAEEAGASVFVEVSPQQVAQDPETFRGRLVEWELQFVSLERAQKVRTDFYDGEPFLLARTVRADSAMFVYVALPPERLSEMAELTPLERIRVIGRIRVGAASLTGSPIIDLLELKQGRMP